MTLPHVIEGELVRDWMEYEYDDLEIGGVDVMRFVLDNLGPGRAEDVGAAEGMPADWHVKTHFGRVRLTIEVLGPGDVGDVDVDVDVLRAAVRADQGITAPDPPCPGCGTTTPYHERGCIELARIQRAQLATWRAAGGEPGPHWAAREAEIERLLRPDG